MVAKIESGEGVPHQKGVNQDFGGVAVVISVRRKGKLVLIVGSGW